MVADYADAFSALKEVFADVSPHLQVLEDGKTQYLLHTRKPSPMPQHKGQPMYFGSVRLGKAYASFHLMPLYMHAELTASISPALRKRMQGKTCFNFKAPPEPELTGELHRLTGEGYRLFVEKGWA